MRKRAVVLCMLIGAAVCAAAPAWCGREAQVVIFDFETHASENLHHLQKGVGALLPSRIAVPGSIAVVDTAALQQYQSARVQEKIAAARKYGADYAIVGTITKIGSVISIDAQLLDVRTGRQCLPLVAQCDGLNTVIPELTVFARKAQEKIMQEMNPRLEDVDAPAHSTRAAEHPVDIQDDYGARETELAEQVVTPQPPSVRRKRRAPPKPAKPAFVMPESFFAQAPAYVYDISAKPMHALAAGDVDGDGAPELLAAGQDEIRILKAGGKTLTPCGTVSAASDEHIVQIAAGDMNRNGIDEIYVSSYEGHYANSFVVEYSRNEYRRIAAGQKLFFRVYTPSDDNATLLGQEASLANPFSGTLFRFEWRDGTLQSREEFLMPGGAGIYSFADGYPDEQEGKTYFVFSKGFFGSDYRFAMLSATGKTLWSDTMKLGGSPNYFTQSMYGDEIQQQTFVPLRIIADEFGPRSRLGIIVGRNSKKGGGMFNKLLSYNQSEVLCLVWNGTDLVTNWNSGTMPGYTADYLLADLDRDGIRELYILTVASQGIFGKSANRITVFPTAQ